MTKKQRENKQPRIEVTRTRVEYVAPGTVDSMTCFVSGRAARAVSHEWQRRFRVPIVRV